MAGLRFALVAVNTVAFAALVAVSIGFGRRESSPRVRRLWLVVTLAGAALLLSSLQRLLLQAATLGLIDESSRISALEEWQVYQSLAVTALVVAVVINLKRLADSMSASERIAGSILDRVGHVDPGRLDLTSREREVLATIGQGLITDAELSEALHISPSTVQSHVKSLLRKSGLRRRQDLVGVAFLVESDHRGPGR